MGAKTEKFRGVSKSEDPAQTGPHNLHTLCGVKRHLMTAAHRPSEVVGEESGNRSWDHESYVLPRRARLQHENLRVKRRRPGCSLVVGILSVGAVLVVQTCWPENVVDSPGEGGGPADVVLSQLLAGERTDQRPLRTASVLPPLPPLPSLHPSSLGRSSLPRDEGAAPAVLASNLTAEMGLNTTSQQSAPSKPAPLPAQHTAPKALLPAPETPVVQYIDTGKQVLRDRGGAAVTVHGKNFGDEDSEIEVRIGNTWCPHSEWISDETVVARSPEGVGKHLDVTVRVDSPSFRPAVGVGKELFSFSRPFIFDVVPFKVGSPLTGPTNITLKAWGIGCRDSSPEASINGMRCAKTVWVDNSSVICEIPKQARVALENPEIKVAGQRSMCGIRAPGVCTVSTHFDGVSDPERLAETIREIRARGGDWKAVARSAKDVPTIGDLGAENAADQPCTNIGNCTAKTLFLSLSSAVLMMMGMGSLCLCIILAKPVIGWMSDDWQRAREESKLGEYDDVLDADERRTAAEERGLPAESEEPDQDRKSVV